MVLGAVTRGLHVYDTDFFVYRVRVAHIESSSSTQQRVPVTCCINRLVFYGCVFLFVSDLTFSRVLRFPRSVLPKAATTGFYSICSIGRHDQRNLKCEMRNYASARLPHLPGRAESFAVLLLNAFSSSAKLVLVHNCCSTSVKR